MDLNTKIPGPNGSIPDDRKYNPTFDIDKLVGNDILDGFAKQATHEEICDQALSNYREVADKCGYWSSTIEHAIKFYKEHGNKKELL